MKIGITEYGDAGIDFRWTTRVQSMDGAILITKNMNDRFIEEVLKTDKPVIVHCTCTGWGGTDMEPHVPDYRTQLQGLQTLISRGFPEERCVLRIDPVIPTAEGLRHTKDVLDAISSIDTGKMRFRMSIVDEYRHVKERLRLAGRQPAYGDYFQAAPWHEKAVANLFKQYPYRFGTCAEDRLARTYPDTFVRQGCISSEDLRLLGLPEETFSENPQHRTGCHCLSCKTELLTPRKPCPHKCLYCFWK